MPRSDKSPTPPRTRPARLSALPDMMTLDAAGVEALAACDWIATPDGTRLHVIRYGERHRPPALRRFVCGSKATGLRSKDGELVGAALVSGVPPPQQWRCGDCVSTVLAGVEPPTGARHAKRRRARQ